MFTLRTRNALQSILKNANLKILERHITAEHGRLPKVTINQEEKRAEVIVPGYSYADLDRMAVRNLTTWMSIITKCRHLAWNQDFLQMNSRLRSTGMTFITSLRLSAPAGAHCDTQVLHDSNSQTNIHFTMALGHVGVSSYETYGSVWLEKRGTETLIFEYTLFWVYMDRETRKVSKLPVWFTEDNAACSSIPRSSRVEIPDFISLVVGEHGQKDEVLLKKKCFIIGKEHIDKFQHTNHEVYIQFIASTVLEYLGDLEQGRNLEEGHQRIVNFEVTYKGESNLGDELWVELYRSGPKFTACVHNQGKVIVGSLIELEDRNENRVSSKL